MAIKHNLLIISPDPFAECFQSRQLLEADTQNNSSHIDNDVTRIAEYHPQRYGLKLWLPILFATDMARFTA